MTTSPAYTENVKIYPLVGMKSFRIPEAAGAWRLFVIAKNMAGQLDHIKRDDLRQVTRELGVNDAQWKRYITAGRNLDLFKDVQQKTGEWSLILVGNKKASELLGADTLGSPVTLPAKLLFKKGWRAYVFASWQSAFTGNGTRLVSQKKQSDITGIDPQTQRQFNKQAGVISQKNFAISNQHASRYAATAEYGNRAALFKYWDKEKHQLYLGWRIPDSRVFPLYGANSSYNTPKTMSLFNRTPEQYAATKKAIRKQDVEFTEMYIYDKLSAKGNALWIHQSF
jgi:hypothetical protein